MLAKVGNKRKQINQYFQSYRCNQIIFTARRKPFDIFQGVNNPNNNFL